MTLIERLVCVAVAAPFALLCWPRFIIASYDDDAIRRMTANEFIVVCIGSAAAVVLLAVAVGVM